MNDTKSSSNCRYDLTQLPPDLKELELKNVKGLFSFPSTLEKLAIRRCARDRSESQGTNLTDLIRLKEIIFEDVDFPQGLPPFSPSVEKLKITHSTIGSLEAKDKNFVNLIGLKEIIFEDVDFPKGLPPFPSSVEKLKITHSTIGSLEAKDENSVNLIGLKEIIFEDVDFPKGLPPFPPSVEILTIKAKNKLEAEDNVFANLIYLKELKLENFSGNLPSFPPALERIEITGKSFWGYEIPSNNLANLKHLKELMLGDFRGVLPAPPPILEKLEISSKYILSVVDSNPEAGDYNPEVDGYSLTEYTYLKELTLRGCKGVLFSLPLNLERLEITGLIFKNEPQDNSLVELTQLKELIFQGFWEDLFSSLPSKLEKLKIKEVKSEYDPDFENLKSKGKDSFHAGDNNLARFTPHLKELILEGFTGTLPSLPSSLKKLNISRPKILNAPTPDLSILDELKSAIAQDPTVLANLTSLVIDGCELIDKFNAIKYEKIPREISSAFYKSKPDSTEISEPHRDCAP